MDFLAWDWSSERGRSSWDKNLGLNTRESDNVVGIFFPPKLHGNGRIHAVLCQGGEANQLGSSVRLTVR
jgi:hypothetical protein